MQRTEAQEGSFLKWGLLAPEPWAYHSMVCLQKWPIKMQVPWVRVSPSTVNGQHFWDSAGITCDEAWRLGDIRGRTMRFCWRPVTSGGTLRCARRGTTGSGMTRAPKECGVEMVWAQTQLHLGWRQLLFLAASGPWAPIAGKIVFSVLQRRSFGNRPAEDSGMFWENGHC